jgi:hypothetical protein
MVAFGHTAVGALVGLASYQQFGNSDPISGLIITGAVGVVSHYVMDCFPHGHFFREKDYKKKVGLVIIFDLFLSVALYILTAYYFSTFNILYTLYILFGIGGSQLPDILDGLIYIGILPKKGLLKVEHHLHTATHWHGKKEKAILWNIWDIWQIVIFFSGLYILLINKP